MKYILIVSLFTSILFSQNKTNTYTKVIAYRLVDEYDDGPCNILSYFKEEKVIGYYLQAIESKDENLAYNLIKLKKEAKKWKNKSRSCMKGQLGDEVIPNMIIIKTENCADTIYMTRDNKSVFIPSEQKEYFDKNNNLNKILPKHFIDFFKKDFSIEIHDYYSNMDSISLDKVAINKTQIYGFDRKDFERNFNKFDIIITDSLFYSDEIEIYKQYTLNSLKLNFTNNYGKIDYIYDKYNDNDYKDTYKLSVDDIYVGDPEHKIISKYYSAKLFRNWGAPLDNINGDHNYKIKLQNNAGYAIYYIKDNIVDSISVTFGYLNSK